MRKSELRKLINASCVKTKASMFSEGSIVWINDNGARVKFSIKEFKELNGKDWTAMDLVSESPLIRSFAEQWFKD